jgi:2-polyprenyl-3-methyl-5-hydroxy-6-metoxy-1,4-benzoquinol methylase
MIKKILWKMWSQKNELEFHKSNDWRNTQDFLDQTTYIMNQFGYSPDDFKNEIIIDLGCGSKLRSNFFKNAKIVAIDPLAEDFIKNVPWNDICTAAKYYSKPAEELIPELENSATFLMCINVLDHTFKPRKILENCHKYLKTGGELLVSVDSHKFITPLHPQSLNVKSLESVFSKLEFKILRSYKDLGKIGTSYERGFLHSRALTYVLKK